MSIGQVFYTSAHVLSFRISLDLGADQYSRRLALLKEAVDAVAIGGVWDDPTSALVFRSSRPLDEIGRIVARAINTKIDVVFIVKVDPKEAGLIGDSATDLATLTEIFPYVKRLG